MGKKILMRPINQNDFSLIAKWINDNEVTYYMFYGQKPLTLEQVSQEIQHQINSQNNIVLIITILSSATPIGFAGLYDIHLTARKAELRILIGEKKYWGKGYGTETVELLTYYGFDRLNLNKIWLGVTADNKRALRTYEKSGYKVEGCLRQDIYRNSRYYDSIRMAILREAYYPNLYKKHYQKFGLNIENISRERRNKS